jgi:uncharacterized protein (DUF1778 family)
MSQQKDLRLNIRVTPEQKALIERAASAKRTSLSAFMLDHSCEAAEQILSEQRHFELTPQQWSAFCAALDAPAKEIPALKALFQRPSVFASRPTANQRSSRRRNKSKSTP